MQWPPDYEQEEERRALIQRIFNSTDKPREAARELYADNPVQFINDWCVTYDPRNATKDRPTKMPFLLFDKQQEFVQFLQDCMEDSQSGLVEKSRDMGATWTAVGFSIWLWAFVPGASVGWGSRKEKLVDTIGDPDSIFEKLRMIIDELPWYILPEGFSRKEHCNYMKITGDHGATITGEGGDNIGRGGRKLIYFKDESAHYDRAEMIEAALSDNTDCQIDISSVNGPNNIFHRKRTGGAVKVFVMDWRDHPGKDQKWYDKRREDAETNGLMHVFSQEVDRDYSSSVKGTLIPGMWVKAAIDAHKKLGIKAEGHKRVGFDVADEGGDVNAVISVHGVIVTDLDQWGEGDTGESTIKAIHFAEGLKTNEMVYDSVGVGAGVKATVRTAKTKVKAIGYDGVGVQDPKKDYVEGKKNEDMFASGSAQDWWLLRDRFLATYNAVIKGKDIAHDKMISLPSDLPHLQQLEAELSQVKRDTNGKGLILVDKQPKGTKSPNLADSLKMALSCISESNGPRVRVL